MIGAVDAPRLDPDSSLDGWRDHELPGTYLNDDRIAMFDATGYCLVEGAISRAVLGSVEHEIDRRERERNDWLREQPGRRSWISHGDVVDYAPNLVAGSP
jgi:hypothetical protein